MGKKKNSSQVLESKGEVDVKVDVGVVETIVEHNPVTPPSLPTPVDDDLVVIDQKEEDQVTSLEEKQTPATDTTSATEKILDGTKSLLSGVSNVVGGLVQNFRKPSMPAVNLEVLVMHESKAICQSGALEGYGPSLDARVNDLVWGWASDAKVDKQTICYYRLQVNENHADNGFIVHCNSSKKGRFKLAMFDSVGNLLAQEDSVTSYDHSITSATVFFANFVTHKIPDESDTVQIVRDFPSTLFGGTPSLFHKLDKMTRTPQRKIESGTYLICVYGNNLLNNKSDVNVLAVPSKNDAKELISMESHDESLLALKDDLKKLQTEYVVVKSAFEDCLQKMNEKERRLYNMLQVREEAYRQFILMSARAYSPTESPGPGEANHRAITTLEETLDIKPTKGNTRRQVPQQVGVIMAGTPLEVSSNIASHASGWLANRVSYGFGQLQTLVMTSASNLTNKVNENIGGSLSDNRSTEDIDDPEYANAMKAYENAKKDYESKLLIAENLRQNGYANKRTRAAAAEADKARFVREVGLSTENWLQSFGLDKESKAKQEQYAKEFAEKLLKERLTADEKMRDDIETKAIAEQQELEVKAGADAGISLVLMEEKLAIKNELEKKYLVAKELLMKLKLENEAVLLAERLASERLDGEKKLCEEEFSINKKSEELKCWLDRLEKEKLALQEAARLEKDTKLKQEEEATLLAQKLAVERLELEILPVEK